MSSIFGPAEVVGGIAIGTGVGAAVGDVVVPKLQDFLNQQWANNAHKPLSAGAVAGIVAEDVEKLGWGIVEASLTGISESRFQALYGEALNAPGLPELLALLRRQKIGPAEFAHGLRKAKLETQWDAPIGALIDELLSPQELAVMIQRGIVANDGILPVGPPTGTGKVPPMPMENIDPIVEASHSGYTQARLAALAKIIGLPASPDLAARMVFRQIIDRVDFDRAISEGNTRNEWAPFLFEGFREIPTVTDFVAARLRAWIDTPAMHAGAGLHGMSATDADLLLKIHGRPLSWHQVFIGLRRGGTYDGPTSALDPAFLKALEESDIRPEWYDLAWAQRYNYPAPFVLRSITEAGDIDQVEAETILLYEGWEPKLAKTVSTKWAAKAGTAAGVNPYVKKAETSLFTAMHKAAVGAATEPPAIQEGFDALAVPQDAQTEIRKLWAIEGRL